MVQWNKWVHSKNTGGKYFTARLNVDGLYFISDCVASDVRINAGNEFEGMSSGIEGTTEHFFRVASLRARFEHETSWGRSRNTNLRRSVTEHKAPICSLSPGGERSYSHTLSPMRTDASETFTVACVFLVSCSLLKYITPRVMKMKVW